MSQHMYRSINQNSAEVYTIHKITIIDDAPRLG
jgi:hypothetical protein